VLQELGIWDTFLDQRPARTRRCLLRFGSRAKQWKLPEPAFGLSRLELDRLLLNHAIRLGAKVSKGQRSHTEADRGPIVVNATGRRGKGLKPGRLFGFKSHFEGPSDDAVEIFFGPSSYIGISTVEDGIVNICGLAPESALRRYDFLFDDFVFSFCDLRDRLKRLSRRMPWLSTGPVVFSGISHEKVITEVQAYAAGDALSFVDPFTGSGILNALLTGRMAGEAAATGLTPDTHVYECYKLMQRPIVVSALFRTLLDWGCARYLTLLFPGEWLYRFTRPTVLGTKVD
jgi:menaquinone-9 beta-reductase